VVNVVLNIQPVISTVGAFLLFGDRLAHRFFLYAAIAIIAGVFVSCLASDHDRVSFEARPA
jgi:drug/metabolite transporter (DMT)-like permease